MRKPARQGKTNPPVASCQAGSGSFRRAAGTASSVSLISAVRKPVSFPRSPRLGRRGEGR
jgi:hypothetical protein